MARPPAQLHQSVQREHFFRDAQEALAAIRLYTERLRGFALAQNRAGRALSDQSFATEIFALRPKHTTALPLVLVGGMGPLAGADGFERACRRFLNTREIVLFQACSIPDRTSAYLEFSEARGRCTPEYLFLLESLATAIGEAVACLRSDVEPFKLIVLCNTCHFFLPETLRRLGERRPQLSDRLRLTSLIESAIETIKQRGYGRILALYTLGTRLSRVYSQRFTSEGLSYLEATATLEQSLMGAIFSGVKAFDVPTGLAAGTRFFHELLAADHDFDCIVAGCTELPFIINHLSEMGSDRVKAFLRRTEIIDPVAAALSLV